MSEVLRQLFAKQYINNSSAEVWEQLKFLAEAAPGYIADLLIRPEVWPGGKLLEITSIQYERDKPIFGILTFCDVLTYEGTTNNQQFHSWRQGPNSATKALVAFVENRGGKRVITHLCFLEKFKFPIGRTTLDLIGGFSESGEIGNATLRRELEEEVGITQDDIVETIPLGRLMVDAGMTNNHPNLALVLVRPNNSEKFAQHINTDPHEMPGKFKIYPWSSLEELVKTNDDAFFLAAVARMAFIK